MKRRMYIKVMSLGMAILILAMGVCWAFIETDTNVSGEGSKNIENTKIIDEGIEAKSYDTSQDVIEEDTLVSEDTTDSTKKEGSILTESGKLNLDYLSGKKIPLIYEDDPDRQARLSKACEREPMLKAFALGYPDNPWNVTGGYTEEELAKEHPHFLQYDLRWGYHEYGTTVMGFTGCAPTAMAMVALELVGDTSVTPDVVADYSTEMGTYLENSGTTWDFFTKCDEHFGIEGKILPLNEEKMKSELDQGHPIIISLGPGDFTQYGHIAVVVDYDDDGFIINDPGSTIRTAKRWTFETLVPQIKQLWVYKKL